jgi:hypothetical protein
MRKSAEELNEEFRLASQELAQLAQLQEQRDRFQEKCGIRILELLIGQDV